MIWKHLCITNFGWFYTIDSTESVRQHGEWLISVLPLFWIDSEYIMITSVCKECIRASGVAMDCWYRNDPFYIFYLLYTLWKHRKQTNQCSVWLEIYFCLQSNGYHFACHNTVSVLPNITEARSTRNLQQIVNPNWLRLFKSGSIVSQKIPWIT